MTLRSISNTQKIAYVMQSGKLSEPAALLKQAQEQKYTFTEVM